MDKEQIDNETQKDKWNRAIDIFLESVLKPDQELRQCAHDQKCYHELMNLRESVLEYINTLRWR